MIGAGSFLRRSLFLLLLIITSKDKVVISKAALGMTPRRPY